MPFGALSKEQFEPQSVSWLTAEVGTYILYDMVCFLLALIIPVTVLNDVVRIEELRDPVQREVNRLTDTPGALAKLCIEVWIGPKFKQQIVVFCTWWQKLLELISSFRSRRLGIKN